MQDNCKLSQLSQLSQLSSYKIPLIALVRFVRPYRSPFPKRIAFVSIREIRGQKNKDLVGNKTSVDI